MMLHFHTGHGLVLLVGLLLNSRIERSQSNGIRNIRRNMQHTNSEEIITTTACSQIRNRKDYNARVDFTYLYVFEYSSMNEDLYAANEIPILVLHSIERAIATSVATTLVQCTANELYPLYAVDTANSTADNDGTNSTTSSKHIIVPSSYITNYTKDFSCPLSTTNNGSLSNSTDVAMRYGCITARGMTSILFNDADDEQQQFINNSNVTSQGMDWTYIDTLITATIEDVYYLNQFVLSNSALLDSHSQIIRTLYAQSIGNTMILLPILQDNDPIYDTSGGGGTNEIVKVAIIAAVLSFTFTVMVLSLILCYWRCFTSNGDHQRHNTTNENRHTIPKRRPRNDLFSFEPLDDDLQYSDSNDPNASPTGLMVVTSHRNNEITTTLSQQQVEQEQHQQQVPTVSLLTTTWSDITSDSESIMSSLHLDRIDEVDEELGDHSYEQHLSYNDGSDRNQSNIHTLKKVGVGDEDIEVSWRDDLEARKTHPDCTSLDFVADWNISYHNTEDSFMNESTDSPNEHPEEEAIQTIVDLSVEIPIDDEVVILSTNTVDADENIVHPFPTGIADSSFTFSSDDEGDVGPREHVEESILNRTQSGSVGTIPAGHIYDADDFQSIEISVVWIDNEELDGDNHADDMKTIIQTASVDMSVALVAPEIEEYEMSKGNISVDKEMAIDVTVTSGPIVSELTDSNKYMLHDSTESTMYTNDEQSFSSSNAYRSVLEIVSYSTNVNESNTNGSSTTTNDDSPLGAANMTVVAHWARDVMLKLMSDSPKMLQCDRVKDPRNDDEEEVDHDVDSSENSTGTIN